MRSGRSAVGIATIVNQQQAAGLTQSGNPGPAHVRGGRRAGEQLRQQHRDCAGDCDQHQSLSALTTDNYTLTDNGGTWQLYDQTSQQALTMSGDGSAGNPFTAAGLSIVVNGAANSGDSYLIQPTANAAAGFSVLLTQPDTDRLGRRGADRRCHRQYRHRHHCRGDRRLIRPMPTC